MDVGEIETLKSAVTLLEAHGHADAAEAVKEVLVSEFAKLADSVAQGSPEQVADAE
ncbi:Uncharacterised protein [Mycobacteroides abscessus subsp. abscessus]|jgi:hypothetical protein|nr:Uncharacterised protein [Mycobacteroides abscessus subsp. abscessus]